MEEEERRRRLEKEQKAMDEERRRRAEKERRALEEHKRREEERRLQDMRKKMEVGRDYPHLFKGHSRSSRRGRAVLKRKRRLSHVRVGRQSLRRRSLLQKGKHEVPPAIVAPHEPRARPVVVLPGKSNSQDGTMWEIRRERPT